MRTCALVAAVDFNEEHFRACDARGMFGTVIAVDAGLKHLDDIGREPDIVLGDFDSYVKAFEEMDKIYSDKYRWNAMSLANIANSAFFSSDRTIAEYAEDIWHTK